MVLETSGLGDAGEGLTLVFDLAASWAHLLRSNFFSQLTRYYSQVTYFTYS